MTRAFMGLWVAAALGVLPVESLAQADTTLRSDSIGVGTWLRPAPASALWLTPSPLSVPTVRPHSAGRRRASDSG